MPYVTVLLLWIASDGGRVGVGKVLESFVYEGEWSVGARAPTELLEDDLVGYREAVEA